MRKPRSATASLAAWAWRIDRIFRFNYKWLTRISRVGPRAAMSHSEPRNLEPTMKTFSLTLLAALTLSATTALAKPVQPPPVAPARPMTIDHRGPAVPAAPPVMTMRPMEIDHRGPATPTPSKVAYRAERAWSPLASITATGRDDVIKLPRAHAIDDLRLEVTRGAASVKQIIVTFANKRSVRIPVNQLLRAGDSKLITLPGDARTVTRVQIEYGAKRPAARGTQPARLVLSAR
ncbi:MAG: hypothetical protein IPL61_04870 [Myxococcales bacterium]|nr:hypothetical protein [Myxococcales bacterium]